MREKKTRKTYNVLKRSKMGFSDFSIFRSPGPGYPPWGVPPPSEKNRVFGVKSQKYRVFLSIAEGENFLDLHFSFKGFLIRNYIFEASEQKYFPSNSVFIYLPDPKLSKNQVFCGSTLFKFLTPKKNTIIILRINLFAKNTGIESTIGFKLKWSGERPRIFFMFLLY